MKFCSSCEQFKPISNFGPRKQSPDGLRPQCYECRRAYSKMAWRKNLEDNRRQAAQRRREKYQADPVFWAAKAAAYRVANPRPKKPLQRLSAEERLIRKRASRKKTYEKNKAKVLAQAAIYRAAHKAEERVNRAARYQRNKVRVAAVTKAYRQAHPWVYTAADARRRAAEINATPKWANLKAIAVFYEEASRLTRETGIPHEVDHIVPIQGKLVCGLHVEANLQIVTRAVNRSKSNRFDAHAFTRDMVTA